MDELTPSIEHRIADAEVSGDEAFGEIRMFEEQWPSARALRVGTVVGQERDAELALRAIDVPRKSRARWVGRDVEIGRFYGLPGNPAHHARELRMKEQTRRLAVQAVSLCNLVIT